MSSKPQESGDRDSVDATHISSVPAELTGSEVIYGVGPSVGTAVSAILSAESSDIREDRLSLRAIGRLFDVGLLTHQEAVDLALKSLTPGGEQG